MTELPNSAINGPICFIVPRTSGGGVVSRITKWTRTLETLGQKCVVVILDDRSSLYTRKALPELFAHTSVCELSYDSCDKMTITAARLANEETLQTSKAIVVSQFTGMHALGRQLRTRGWSGVHVEVVPADDELIYSINQANLAECDVAIGVSSEIAIRLKKMLPETPVAACAGGADVAPLSRGEREKQISPLRICYVGRLDPVQKRVFDLVEVARQAKDRGLVCEWTLVGGGNCESELKQKFAEGGIERVRFLGKIPHRDVPALMRTQHVFVLTSAFEGTSNSLCEAMEAGVVPIATRVSGTADAIDHEINGFIVNIGDTDAIAAHLVSLQTPSVWQSMSFAARQKAETALSSEASVTRLLRAIDDGIVQRSRGVSRTSIASRKRAIEAPWMPNTLTRLTRKIWRALKARPADLGKRSQNHG